MEKEQPVIGRHNLSGNEKPDPFAAWEIFTKSLSAAGRMMDDATKGLSSEERADGFRALIRTVNNQLARLEVDRINPEFSPFNTWRQKFFMDNPDFLYWVADIDDKIQYRITGNRGDAVFMSITVYAGKGLKASSEARVTSDELHFNDEGDFEVVLSRERFFKTETDWLEMPEGGNVVWLRQFYNDVHKDTMGSCEIEGKGDAPVPPFIEPVHFSRRMARLGPLFEVIATTFTSGQAGEIERGNHIREWSRMQGGAVYTEPGIFYHRGAWKLEPGQGLVITGQVVEARYWNIQLYSRYLNSLDHRYRKVSLTGGQADINPDGTFRLVLSAEDPGVTNWLDTEGRPFGMFVIRWLHPVTKPELPGVRMINLSEIRGDR